MVIHTELYNICYRATSDVGLECLKSMFFTVIQISGTSFHILNEN